MNCNEAGAARVSVAGHEFGLLKADEVVCAQGATALRECLTLDIRDEGQVLAQLRRMVDLLDGWLGAGACVTLAGGEPVSMRKLLGWVTEVLAQRSRWYAAYLADEYGGDLT